MSPLAWIWSRITRLWPSANSWFSLYYEITSKSDNSWKQHWYWHCEKNDGESIHFFWYNYFLRNFFRRRKIKYFSCGIYKIKIRFDCFLYFFMVNYLFLYYLMHPLLSHLAFQLLHCWSNWALMLIMYILDSVHAEFFYFLFNLNQISINY